MCKLFKVFSLRPNDENCKDVGVIVHYEEENVRVSELINEKCKFEDNVEAAKAAKILNLQSLFKYLTENNLNLHYLHLKPRPISSQFPSHSPRFSTLSSK